MHDRPQFIFATCQPGAEPALKAEIARAHPEFHFAFSRPGFLTFKLPEEHDLVADFELGSVFARSHGFSLGRVQADDVDRGAQAVWELYGSRPVRQIHIWSRAPETPRRQAEESAVSTPNVPAATDAWQAIRRHCLSPESLRASTDDLRATAERGDFVLDCVLVDPLQWWVGYHRAQGPATRWPGGMPPIELPENAVSRAWLKMEEALRWSELPIPAGARVAEIGSAPGGASQALLARGFEVWGIDPAAMDPRVLGEPRFTHLRRRAVAVPRREFRKIRWLTADMNVAPKCTLDIVEDIVSHRETAIRGMLLTLKLPDWKLADQLPEYLARVKGWGYNVVRARQLCHNRREICVAALQTPFRSRPRHAAAGSRSAQSRDHA